MRKKLSVLCTTFLLPLLMTVPTFAADSSFSDVAPDAPYGRVQKLHPPISLSRNPVCTQEQTGSRTYMSEKTAKRNEDNRFLHFHVANFFKFMAANLSFTQFVT